MLSLSIAPLEPRNVLRSPLYFLVVLPSIKFNVSTAGLGRHLLSSYSVDIFSTAPSIPATRIHPVFCLLIASTTLQRVLVHPTTIPRLSHSLSLLLLSRPWDRTPIMRRRDRSSIRSRGRGCWLPEGVNPSSISSALLRSLCCGFPPSLPCPSLTLPLQSRFRSRPILVSAPVPVSIPAPIPVPIPISSAALVPVPVPVHVDIYRKHRSLGTPPRLTFQARLLHNQEGANAEKGGFRKISSRAFFRRIGRCSHHLGLSLESQSITRGCAKTLMLIPILTVYIYICTYACMYTCMYGHHASAGWASTGMVTDRSCDQLAPFAPENLVSQDGFGRPPPASACSFSTTPRLNLVEPPVCLRQARKTTHNMYLSICLKKAAEKLTGLEKAKKMFALHSEK